MDPLRIVLEDLHWADPGTVVALRALGRRLAHLPIASLGGTFRRSPRSSGAGLRYARRGAAQAASRETLLVVPSRA